MSETQAVVKAPTGLTIDRVLTAYLTCRDKRKALKKEYEDKDKPLMETETSLSSWIQRYLLDNKLQNCTVKGVGLAFLTTKITASLSDPDAFMAYVIENQKFELLDRKANKTAVVDFEEANGRLPPGVKLHPFQTIGVHKKVVGVNTPE